MLEAEGLSFSYAKQKPLFAGVCLSVAPTDRLALQAPSGFGKTTLCKILAGYLEPTQGCVRVDGKPLPKKGASPVQLVFQHPEKAVDPRMRMERVIEEAGPVSLPLMERLGIRQAWLSRYPHELSGGELQRFCIARALTASPRYLIADEVTTMLDAVTQAQIWHVLIEEAERKGIGIVLVTHSPALTACVATRTIDLVTGSDPA